MYNRIQWFVGGVGVFRVVKGGKVYIIRRWGAYYKEIRYIS